ncbi:MAG: redoxin domain-containing protein [Limnohabitans sp.]|nr:redoxin domain-containing protein [Limnohabitans sp.]
MPFYSNKEVILIEYNGLRKDTIFKNLLDEKGFITIDVKKIKKNTGIAELKIKDKDLLSYDFILSPYENTTLQCSGEYVYSENTKHINSLENNNLNRWFESISRTKSKFLAITEVEKLYSTKNKFTKSLETEKRELEIHLSRLEDTIKTNNSFAAHYIRYRIAESEIAEKKYTVEKIKTFFSSQIDFDVLFHTKRWFEIINPCLEAYVEGSAYYGLFGNDLILNLQKCKNEQVYTSLAEAGLLITESMNWQNDQEKIIRFLIKDKRIKEPQGKLKEYFKMGKLFYGNKAPNLIIPTGKENKTIETVSLSKKYSLLFFYETECGHCQNTIEYLKQNFEKLNAKGIIIYSFSSDLDLQTFQTSAVNFPWSNKYCDLKGFQGENFKNYAIVGTPTLFLLDEKGIILKKLAKAEEVFEVIK